MKCSSKNRRPMPAPIRTRHDLSRLQRACKSVFLRSLRGLRHGQIVVEEPGLDEVTMFGAAGPLVSLRIDDPEFYRAIVLRGSVGAAEAWMDGHWTCGDLEMLVRIMVRNREVLDGMDSGVARMFGWGLKLWHRLNANSKRGSSRNIAAHYDLGNAFFKSFLDVTMTYSSGIFPHAEASLHEAQICKLGRICTKLDLQSSDHVLEIGTGWGSFAIYAALQYGCRVTTTTISEKQYEEARRRVAVAGLSDRVTVLKTDYRDLEGQFDKLATIEMVEAIGDDFLDGWFGKCASLLRPEGMMAVQAITITDQYYERSLRDVDFIKRYIFPGSFIPSTTRLLSAATKSSDMRLIHMEDFGTHYVETLRRWRSNFQSNHDSVRRMGLSEEFIRMWDYYLCYCAGGFAERFLGVGQFLFRKPLAHSPALLGRLDAC